MKKMKSFKNSLILFCKNIKKPLDELIKGSEYFSDSINNNNNND